MSREINPQIFGNGLKVKAGMTVEQTKEIIAQEVGMAHLREMNNKIEALVRKIREVERKSESNHEKIQRLSQNFQKRTEFIQSNNKKLEEQVKLTLKEIKDKLGTAFLKIKEKQVDDAKIQQILERHNQLVTSFESRLKQMRKVIADQELQLLNCKSIIKEFHKS